MQIFNISPSSVTDDFSGRRLSTQYSHFYVIFSAGDDGRLQTT
jgi:hypothetical protein